MSTYNYQFELDDKSYAVQVTPFEEEGKQRYRILYNDSSSIVMSFNNETDHYDILDHKNMEIPEKLREHFVKCIHKVQESGQEKQAQ